MTHFPWTDCVAPNCYIYYIYRYSNKNVCNSCSFSELVSQMRVNAAPSLHWSAVHSFIHSEEADSVGLMGQEVALPPQTQQCLLRASVQTSCKALSLLLFLCFSPWAVHRFLSWVNACVCCVCLAALSRSELENQVLCSHTRCRSEGTCFISQSTVVMPSVLQ